MASIKIKTNIANVVTDLNDRLKKLTDKDYLLRPVCFDLIDLMTKRIHLDGIGSDGDQIGTYSSGYLKLRQQEYQRSADPKVIVSLTRQLQNDWSVIATANGYAIGFLNAFNLQKARWVEVQKGRIFDLTTGEREYATERLNELTNEALND